MKIVDYIIDAITGIWKFVTRLFLMCFIAFLVLFIFSILMPVEVQGAIEIFKSLLTAGP